LSAPITGWSYFLPGAVEWRGSVETHARGRSLFAVTVYDSRLTASGWFARPDPAALGVEPGDVDWAHAQAILLVSDPGGLQQRVTLRWSGREHPFVPGVMAQDAFGNTLQAPLGAVDLGGDRLPFSLDLVLRGSESLRLLPLGDETTAQITSPWPHPSFVGAPLPAERTVDKGFNASWSVPYFGRGFPQSWRDDQVGPERLSAQLSASAFGVNLVQPADAYQQTERAVKYAVLFILLTFTTVFVLELLSPVRLHAMHYLLVGAALCLFYLLLLALAEHVGLGRAYAAATAGTVGLVTLYTRAVLAGWARALAVAAVLATLYGWLFTVLRAEDYALLLGALGLFATLAVVMFVTRRLDWSTLRFRQPALG
jgi:inner membrane protein